MDTLVVGAGAMGRWFARNLRFDRAVDATIAFVDSDDDTARAAAEDFDGSVLADDAAPDDFDLACVAVPIPAVEAAVAAHAGRLRPDGALVDLVGVMGPAVAAGREHAADRERLSLHPLFAPERSPGRVAAVPDAPGERTATVRRSITAAGNEVFETTPEVHDRAMETVQARAHAAVLAFALAAEPVPAEFATPVLEALAEVAATVTDGDPRVYADVQTALDGADSVAERAREVAEADPETFERLYREAGEPLLEHDDPEDGDGSEAPPGSTPGDS